MPKTKLAIARRIAISEMEEFSLTREECAARTEELLMLSREHLESIYQCRFEVANA